MHLFFNKRSSIKKPKNKRIFKIEVTLVNEKIRFPEIMLLDKDKNNLGIMKTYKALELARSENLDLYCISKKAKPPVCAIGNYFKYQYNLKKKLKELNKHAAFTKIKQIRLRANIAENDLRVKSKKAIEFLTAGNKVNISLALWGRQLQNIEEFCRPIYQMIDLLADYGSQVDTKIRRKGNFFETLIIPKKHNNEKQNENKKRSDEKVEKDKVG